jgi:Zn-dependent M28 family amino/carboxypeptidase
MEEIKSNLISDVRVLSEEIGARSWRDRENMDRTADFIEKKLRAFGLDVLRQGFSYEGGTYYNIFTEIKGKRSDILVVGAHYDTVEGTPGADDNSSGIAALLELARLTSKMTPSRTLRFVAFALEEPPVFRTSRMGSAVYAKSLAEEGIGVEGMIALESIGYYCLQDSCQYYPLSFLKLRYPKRGDFIAFVGNVSSKSFTLKLKSAFKTHTVLPVESLNTIRAVPGVDFSDHRSFWKHGFNAFMVTDTAFFRNPHYHGPGDTPDTLDYDRMAEVVKGLLGGLTQT